MPPPPDLDCGGGGGAVTVTVTVLATEPRGALHVNVKEVVAARAPVVSEPAGLRRPLQPSLAVHEAASVDDQVSTAELPATTDWPRVRRSEARAEA